MLLNDGPAELGLLSKFDGGNHHCQGGMGAAIERVEHRELFPAQSRLWPIHHTFAIKYGSIYRRLHILKAVGQLT